MVQINLPFSNFDETLIKTSFRDFEIFHDESKKDGYWHGMFLIPVMQKQKFYGILENERRKTQYFNSFSFKQIDGPGEKFKLADSWLSLAIGFLRTQPNKEKHIVSSKDTTSKVNDPYILSYEFMGAKFILFRVVDNHKNMKYPEEMASKIEITARFGLKGGLHRLGSSDNPICIQKIHIDGYEHNLRPPDRERIINRIYGLRDYCSFSDRADLIDYRSGNFDKPDHQEHIDCEFLTLTDLLIGAFRVAVGSQADKYKTKLSRHAKYVLNRFSQGAKRMSFSRWANSFFLSQCYLDDEKWKFENIDLSSCLSDKIYP